MLKILTVTMLLALIMIVMPGTTSYGEETNVLVVYFLAPEIPALWQNTSRTH